MGLPDEIRRAISYADWDLTLVQNHFNFGGDSDFEHVNFLSPLPDLLGFGENTNASQVAGPGPLSISPVVDDDKSLVVMDAFRKATGRWVPSTAVNFQAEEEKNLSATHGTDITTDHSGGWDSRLLPDGFPLAARDRLLAMMASACQPLDVPRVAATFPSCGGLGRLVRSFLAWHMSQEDTWIHVPTFSINDVRVELLAAIVAAGAVRSPSRAVQKFGLAVHEILQMQLRNMVRASCSTPRVPHVTDGIPTRHNEQAVSRGTCNTFRHTPSRSRQDYGAATSVKWRLPEEVWPMLPMWGPLSPYAVVLNIDG
jgi:hypothetical protein